MTTEAWTSEGPACAPERAADWSPWAQCHQSPELWGEDRARDFNINSQFKNACSNKILCELNRSVGCPHTTSTTLSNSIILQKRKHALESWSISIKPVSPFAVGLGEGQDRLWWSGSQDAVGRNRGLLQPVDQEGPPSETYQEQERWARDIKQLENCKTL
jgi:hypothetical protein